MPLNLLNGGTVSFEMDQGNCDNAESSEGIYLLDSANASAVHELLVQLNEEFGQTVVVVTHNDQLAALGKKQWVMTDGLLKA